MNKIILASGSPRRRELLEQVGIEYIVDPADVDESTDTVDPRELVMELSLKKAKAVSNKHAGEIILAADTVVSIDNVILGKPLDKADAYARYWSKCKRTYKSW